MIAGKRTQSSFIILFFILLETPKEQEKYNKRCSSWRSLYDVRYYERNYFSSRWWYQCTQEEEKWSLVCPTDFVVLFFIVLLSTHACWTTKFLVICSSKSCYFCYCPANFLVDSSKCSYPTQFFFLVFFSECRYCHRITIHYLYR